MFEDIREEGDFTLSSGKKSKYFYACDKILPVKLRKYSRDLVQTFSLKDERFSFVATAAIGGIPLATCMACELNIPLIVVEKDNTIRGDYSILCDNYLFVDEVISTYGTAKRVQEALECKAGAAACLIFRGEREDPSLPTKFLERKEIEK